MIDLIVGLRDNGMAPVIIEDGASALKSVAQNAPALVVIDEGLPDFEPLPLVMKIIMANALTNTAVISSISDKEFHDKSEGFGVLRNLPVSPSQKDGEELAKQVKRIINL